MRARALILCLVLAVAGASTVSAGGQKESPVAEARALIARKDYAGALKTLAAIQRGDPELRDQVQALIDEVYSIKDKFNAVIVQLNKAREAEDDAAMLSLMAEAERLDPQAAAGIGRSVEERVAFLKLMNEAEDLLAAGKPVDALSRYLLPLKDPQAAGFDMQRPEFQAAGYGALITASVTDSTARILSAADPELTEARAAAAVPAAISTLLGTTLSEASLAAFDAAAIPLLRASAAEGRVRTAAAALADLDRTVATTGGRGKQEPYMEYLVWLCRGRAGRTEGIAEAIDRIWTGRSREVLDAAKARAASGYEVGRERYDTRAFTDADAAFAGSYWAGVMAVKAAALVGSALKTTASTGWALGTADQEAARTLIADTETVQAHAGEAGAYRTLIARRAAVDALPAPQTLAADGLAGVRETLRAAVDAVAASAAQWNARAETLRAQVPSGLVPGDLPDSAARVAGAFSAYGEELRGSDTAYGVRLATLQSSLFATALADTVALHRKGQDLVNGTIDGAPTENAPRKPSVAIGLYAEAADKLAVLQSDLDAFRARWKAEPPWVSASQGVSALLKSSEDLAAQAAKESAEIARLTDLAQTQHAAAVGKRKEADSVFTAASKAFAQKSYDSARMNFLAARDLYSEALVFEDDPVALSRYTTDIANLLAQIDKATREQKLAVVDALFADGRKQFNSGEFLKAFNTLQNALSAWHDLQGDQPYPALESLFEQVRVALKASGGRDLDPTDSRAPAVNAFLSNAYTKVSQADALGRANPQRAQLLDEALVNVQHALDLAPVYRAAKALQLRIRKALAPNDLQFNAQADKEIGDILAAYTSKTLIPERAYFQLKDYVDIRPGYPGLKDLLAQLEVTLGFRSAPVSAANLAESDSQYRNAADVYRIGTADSLNSALTTLNQAIALNPANVQALVLRRTILLKLGSPEVNVLSASDLALFNNAKRLISNGDYAGAYPTLQDLMTKDGGRNKTYAPLASAWLLARQTLGL